MDLVAMTMETHSQTLRPRLRKAKVYLLILANYIILYIFICRSSSVSSSKPTPGVHASEHRTYKLQWKRDWLVDFDSIKNQMICMLCHKRFESLKLDTI